jgi:multidrug efflux system membrane fusion protein
LAQAQAQLAQNKAQLEFAQSDFARVASLKGTQAVSQQDFDQKKNAVDVAKAQIASAQAQITTAQLNLEYCQIRSPIDGRTGQHLVDVGNVIWNSGQNGGSNLLTIQRLNPIYADFTVTENDLATVQRYMKQAHESKESLHVLVDTPNAVNVVEQALGSGVPAATTQSTTSREGTLEFLDNAVQDGTGTVKLRASIPNADNRFWPGQYVSVRLVLTVDKNAVLIPTEAIQISQTGPFVFIAADGKAEQRSVVLGQKQGSLIVIDQGVKAGEQVIVTGQLQLQPGAAITVEGAPTTQAQAGGRS